MLNWGSEKLKKGPWNRNKNTELDGARSELKPELNGAVGQLLTDKIMGYFSVFIVIFGLSLWSITS